MEHFGKKRVREFFKYFTSTPSHIRMKNICEQTKRKHKKEMIVDKQFSFVCIVARDDSHRNEIEALNEE